MDPTVALLRQFLERAHGMLSENVAGITLEEALFIPAGGYRSALGTLKHAAAWSHVYHSFAFDREPRGWTELDWPWGLRQRIEASDAYLAAIIAWCDLANGRWMRSLAGVNEDEIDRRRALHWGQTAPLAEIVTMVASHHIYHAGEINQLLAIYRGEAWEEGEEVEENHISTLGHRVRPSWR